ncbi:MAG TPA: hypothetical protein VGM67_10845 [Gemmatimonadaceae bacterium]|jgi:hypothetical protein
MKPFAYKLAVVGLLCVTELLHAQRVSGHLRESASSGPVPGAVVSLLDSAGHTLARTLSAADGQYHLLGDGRGTSVHVIRIGFRPMTLPVHGTGGDGNIVVDFSLITLPTLLETVAVHDQARCPVVANAPAAFSLWEQARSALLASVVARDVDAPTVRLISYSRELDARSHIQSQAISDTIYVASRPVVASRTAAEFASKGFRDHNTKSAMVTFYGPDADVLLDSTFLQSHCISLREADGDHRDDIGIAFAPVPGQDSVVDVSGVLWLNRTVPALHTLTFRFTNLTFAEMDAAAGGDLLFTVPPNGVAMISHWNLHLPVMSPSLTPPFLPHLAGYSDVGGELAEASWHDGSSWIGPLATISGHVLGKDSHAPVPDAIVRFVGSHIETQTDSSGAFTFPLTVPGPYVIEARDELMADLGVSLIGTTKVVAERAPINNIRLELPARNKAIASLCSDAGQKTARGSPRTLLLGQVRFANGSSSTDAFVSVAWRGVDASGESTGQIGRFSGHTDSTGVFMMCGAPPAVAMTVNATRDSLVSEDERVTIDSSAAIGEVSLTLWAPSLAPLPAYRRRRMLVTDDASHAPLAGVELRDAATDRMFGRTSKDGSVSLAALSPGRTVVHLRKLGYELRTLVVDVQPADSLPMAVPLMSAERLAAVQVTAKTTSRLAYKSGFEDRALAGLGRFLRANDFERHPAERLASVLQGLGVKQAPSGPTGTMLLGGHGQPCPVTIYIDGVLLYSRAMPGQAPPDVSSMMGIDFGGAEYYASGAEVPAEYAGTDSGCGILLLWRKD